MAELSVVAVDGKEGATAPEHEVSPRHNERLVEKEIHVFTEGRVETYWIPIGGDVSEPLR